MSHPPFDFSQGDPKITFIIGDANTTRIWNVVNRSIIACLHR